MTTNQISTSEPLTALAELSMSVWLDSLSRAMIDSGELDRLVRKLGVVGVTANPAIFEKAISGGSEYDAPLSALAEQGLDVVAAYEALAVEDVRAAADVLRPVYDRTGHRDGYASLEVAPDLAHDAEATLASVLDLWRRLDRPNVMIKIPGTPAGVDAIRRATAAGVNVNVTLLLSVDPTRRSPTPTSRGSRSESRAASRSPMSSRWRASSSRASTRPSTGCSPREAATSWPGAPRSRTHGSPTSASASCSRASASPRWPSAARGCSGRCGRRPGVKDERYRDVMYVEELAGRDTVNTMPLATLEAFADHGQVHDALTGSEQDARRTLAELHDAGVDLDHVTERLLVEGIGAFEVAMGKVLASIERRRG